MLADGRVTLNAAVFFSDIDDLQVIADAGSCSSRIVLNAQAESIGAELELFARPTANWDLGLSATWVQAEITETRLSATGQPIAGIRDGNRLPTSPEFQASASATYSWPFSATLEGFANFTFQHVGSSFTQLADQEPGVGCVGCPGAPGFFNVRRPDDQQLHVRAGAAVVRDRQPALRRQEATRGKPRCSSTTCGMSVHSCRSIASAASAPASAT